MSLVVSGASALHQHALFSICRFLAPGELALAARVSRFWRDQIDGQDPSIWKEQSRIQGFDVFGSLKSTLSFDPNILSLIIAYAGLYKDSACFIYGDVKLYAHADEVWKRRKGDGDEEEPRWGNPDPELFVLTQAYSEESIRACEKQHRDGKYGRCKNIGRQQTWIDIHPRLSDFPGMLPLRFFLNKEAGDQIRLRHQGRAVVLTCVVQSEDRDRKKLRKLSEQIAFRIYVALAHKYITQKDVDQAKAMAPISGEWICSGASR